MARRFREVCVLLCRTLLGFTWDLGGHVQFSHYQKFDEYMDLAFPAEDWLWHERESWIWMGRPVCSLSISEQPASVGIGGSLACRRRTPKRSLHVRTALHPRTFASGF